MPLLFIFFFFNDTATTEIYTLSLHDALPISIGPRPRQPFLQRVLRAVLPSGHAPSGNERDDGRMRQHQRSEEHTSELQSPCNLVCRLLLEKKKNNAVQHTTCLTI